MIPHSALDNENVDGLLDWILNSTIALYLASDKINDFFLLHGVTSTWCLNTILGNAFHGDTEKIFQILRLHLGVLIATFITQGAPNLRAERLEQCTQEMKNVSWSEITRKLLEEMPNNADDHVYKMVQVCYETSKKFEHASAHEAIYKKAAMTVMENSFLFL